jgi:mono/diheme cytochrome c family protein
MDAEQLRAVVAYVRVLSPGHELYTRFCAVCHGLDGHPPKMDTEAIGDAEAIAGELPQVAFNQTYFRTHPEEQICRGVQYMLRHSRAIMPHFNDELSTEQVRTILSCLSTSHSRRFSEGGGFLAAGARTGARRCSPPHAGPG